MKHTGVMTFTVGWGDCSPSGAVFYPNYFRWFDAAMWNFFDQADWPLRAMEAEHGNVGLPLIETHVNFKRPCRLHDLLRLETSVTAFRGQERKRIVLGYGMIGDYPHNGIVFTNQSTVTDLKGGFEAL